MINGNYNLPNTVGSTMVLDNHKYMIRDYTENLIKRHPMVSLSNLANAIHIQLPTNATTTCSTINVSDWLIKNHAWLELPVKLITRAW